jgi:hypothetical protein
VLLAYFQSKVNGPPGPGMHRAPGLSGPAVRLRAEGPKTDGSGLPGAPCSRAGKAAHPGASPALQAGRAAGGPKEAFHKTFRELRKQGGPVTVPWYNR